MKTKTRKQSKLVKKTTARRKAAPNTPKPVEPQPLSNEEMQRLDREAVGN